MAAALGSLSALGALTCSGFASENDRAPAALELEPSILVSSVWDCTTSSDVADPFEYSEAVTLPLSIQVIDIFTRSTPQNLEVRACLITDPTCERPIGPSVSADSNGIVTLPLPVGVSGFLELTADGTAPALFVLPRPLSVELASLLRSHAVVLVSNDSTAGAALEIRTQATPDTGVLVVTVLDCQGRGAAGVRIELDKPALPFSIVDGLPILNQRTTTSYATVGFIDVAPGVSVISGYRVDTEEMVGRAAVPVRPGWDTLVYMLPEEAP